MKITPNFSPSHVKLAPELEKMFKKSTQTEAPKTDFGNVLEAQIQKVDVLQKSADQASTDLATGKPVNLHEAILKMEMADTSLRMLVTVRNRALEAYQEIMKMPI